MSPSLGLEISQEMLDSTGYGLASKDPEEG